MHLCGQLKKQQGEMFYCAGLSWHNLLQASGFCSIRTKTSPCDFFPPFPWRSLMSSWNIVMTRLCVPSNHPRVPFEVTLLTQCWKYKLFVFKLQVGSRTRLGVFVRIKANIFKLLILIWPRKYSSTLTKKSLNSSGYAISFKNIFCFSHFE